MHFSDNKTKSKQIHDGFKLWESQCKQYWFKPLFEWADSLSRPWYSGRLFYRWGAQCHVCAVAACLVCFFLLFAPCQFPCTFSPPLALSSACLCVCGCGHWFLLQQRDAPKVHQLITSCYNTLVSSPLQWQRVLSRLEMTPVHVFNLSVFVSVFSSVCLLVFLLQCFTLAGCPLTLVFFFFFLLHVCRSSASNWIPSS